MNKQQKPPHCVGCIYYYKAGHPKDNRLHGNKFDNWCCQYSRAAPKAVGMCILKNGKSIRIL